VPKAHLLEPIETHKEADIIVSTVKKKHQKRQNVAGSDKVL
jgi:hypothetical protein